MAPDLTQWYKNHDDGYEAVKERLRSARSVLLNGHIGYAAENLRLSYVNAVFSIKTKKERHEDAFMAYVNGADIREAALMCVYGGQKADWIQRTFDNTNWKDLARAVRSHVKAGRISDLLEIQNELVGVSYTKWSFTLAMCGVWEIACFDSNARHFFDIDTGRTVRSADEYIELIEQLQSDTEIPEKPFVIQWAIYDYERGEHARHMPFFRNICL